jgi:hypothetical protein
MQPVNAVFNNKAENVYKRCLSASLRTFSSLELADCGRGGRLVVAVATGGREVIAKFWAGDLRKEIRFILFSFLLFLSRFLAACLFTAMVGDV